ncbi:hypothetical protein D3C75_1307680 [compost metagenome]
MQVELGFQQVPLETVGMACALHQGPARRALTPHKQRHPDESFIADHGDLRRGAILHHVQ